MNLHSLNFLSVRNSELETGDFDDAMYCSVLNDADCTDLIGNNRTSSVG